VKQVAIILPAPREYRLVATMETANTQFATFLCHSKTSTDFPKVGQVKQFRC